MKVKTVINCNVSKVHRLIQADNWKASFADEKKDGVKGIYETGGQNVRLNLYQKQDVSPEDYRAWVRSNFTETEIQSIH